MPILTSILALPTPFFLTVLIIFSACIGSFINVLAYRLPLMIEGDETINLALPRSFCPQCKTTIAWYDNIPLLSYLWLRAKCRHCQQAISTRYFFIELLTIALSVICFLLLGKISLMLLALVFTWWMIPMIIIDIDHYILPDQLTISLLWLGLLCNIDAAFVPLSQAVIGAVVGYGLLWLIDSLYYLLRKRHGLGGGDWKLVAAFGAWFGPYAAAEILLIACILGSVVGLAGMAVRKLNFQSMLPFGPFLCLTGWLWIFTNDRMTSFLMSWLLS